MKKVYAHLYNDLNFDKVSDGLIIYPDEEGVDTLLDVDIKQNSIKDYYGFYKLGVRIPQIR